LIGRTNQFITAGKRSYSADLYIIGQDKKRTLAIQCRQYTGNKKYGVGDLSADLPIAKHICTGKLTYLVVCLTGPDGNITAAAQVHSKQEDEYAVWFKPEDKLCSGST
jgi:hypothetical protein